MKYFLPEHDITELEFVLKESRLLFEGRRIFISGSTGLIGSYLYRYLLDLARLASIRFDLFLTTRDRSLSKRSFSHFNCRINYIFCDFHDYESLRLVCSSLKNSIDILFHFASPSAPNDYRREPFHTFYTNPVACIHLTDILKQSRTDRSKFVYSSTTGIYGVHEDQEYPLSEETQCIINPSDPSQIYNIAKLSAEQILVQQAAQTNISFYSLRLNINYGPGIKLDDGRALSDFIQSGMSKLPIQLKSFGDQTRNYLYLSDTIRAIILLISRVQESCTVNISNSEDITIYALAKLIAEYFGTIVLLPQKPVSHSGVDFKRTSVDVSTLNFLTDWKPLVSMKEGIVRVILSLHKLKHLPNQ